MVLYKWKNINEDPDFWSNGRVQTKKIELMRILIFSWMVVHKWNKLISEDTNFWSNGRAWKKEKVKEDQIICSNGRAQIK